MNESNQARYAALDTYRFLAASGVVLYHFENHFQPFLPAPTHVLERFQHLVDFFFVLSGFVIMHCYGDRIHGASSYVDFLRRRLARIYPLHLATIALFCLAGLVLTRLRMPVRDTSFFDLSLVPANLLLVQAWGGTAPGLNVPSWSISAEWFVYLLFPLLAFGLRRIGPLLTLASALAFGLSTEAIRQRIALAPLDVATFDGGALRALPSFIAGMAVQLVVNRWPARAVSWTSAHLVALTIVALMLWQAPPLLILALFPVLVGLVAMAERSGASTVLTSRAAVVLGQASFAIYMIHTPFQVMAVQIARRAGWTSLSELVVLALAAFAAIVLTALASYRWFEDPLRRRLSRSRDRAHLIGAPAR